MPFIQSWFDGVGFLHHGLCPGVLLLVVLLEFLDWQGRKSEIGVCPGMASYLFEHQPPGLDRSSLRGKGGQASGNQISIEEARAQRISRAMFPLSLAGPVSQMRPAG